MTSAAKIRDVSVRIRDMVHRLSELKHHPRNTLSYEEQIKSALEFSKSSHVR